MGADEATGEERTRTRLTRWLLALADLGLYVFVFNAALIVSLSVVSFLLGAGWLGVKYGLFVLGVFLFGVGAIRLRPRAAWKDGELLEKREEPRLQTIVEALPPFRHRSLDADGRLSPAAKLFVASLVVLLVSFLMETLLGVSV